MEFYSAGLQDFKVVKKIVRHSIKTIFPNYYPQGVVAFFLKYHSDEAILRDIEDQKVYLLEVAGNLVATGSLNDNEIRRVFVLPQYQGHGYATIIMTNLERIIAQNYNRVKLDASLPAYSLYLRLGYTPVNYHKFKTFKGHILCYHTMEKVLTK